MARYFFYLIACCASFTGGIALAGLMQSRATVASLQPSAAPVQGTNYHDFLFPPSTSSQTDLHVAASDPEFKKSFCNDRRIQPIWKALRRDRSFREQLTFTYESQNCTAILEIYYKDLNRDGTPEVLVRGKTVDACGGVGNCLFWILEKTRNGYRTLIASSDYVDRAAMGDQVRRASTRGYSDILLRGHMSASETTYSYYKFNGRRYVESKCLYELPVRYKGDEAVWGFITCTEFTRRLDAEIAASKTSVTSVPNTIP